MEAARLGNRGLWAHDEAVPPWRRRHRKALPARIAGGTMRVAFACFVLATLTGCVTPPPQTAESEVTAAIDALKSALDSDRRLDPIRDKVSLGDARRASSSMLSLTSHPTEEERQALQEWHEVLKAHRPDITKKAQRAFPWAVPVYDLLWASGLSLLAELYSGKISYAEYNHRKLAMVTRGLKALDQRASEVQRDRPQGSSAALASFRNYLLEQQLINQEMQPARLAPFTCTRMGNTTNCF